MTFLSHFVDRTIPGLSGADMVRLIRRRGARTVPGLDINQLRDLGLDRRSC